VSLRIACDLDGTIADMDAALQREAQRLFGPDVNLRAAPGEPLESAEDMESQVGEAPITAGDEEVPEAVSPAPGQGGRPLTNRELRTLWQRVSQIENFWTTLGEIEPGVVARLASLATQHRWEVIFLTQRPASAGETTQIQSQRWLRAHGFELPGVMVMMHGSRGKVADALTLDAVIDDRPENCLDVATDSSAMPILIWRLRPELVPAGLARTRIEPVFSFAEALAKLEQLTAERGHRRGLLGRLRSAFSSQ
jgi:hypothetical protein